MTTSFHSDYEYDFVPPPECPVYEPTAEEFKDALAYLEKIRPEAEQHGICKIKPPEDWQPPFAVDVDKLKFTPRIQRLNELEAHTRIKLNFLDQVAKFWELQGSSLKIPLVEKRALDLFTLKKYVEKEGGMEKVNEEKKWSKVAQDMGYNMTNKNIGNLLKSHYERILFPLEVFEREEKRKMEAMKEEPKEEPMDDSDDEKEYKPHNIPSRMGMKPPADKDKAGRRSKRFTDDKMSPLKKEDESKSSFSKELARLQFVGAGPKMSIPNDKTTKEKTRGLKLSFDYDPLAKYMCQTCGKGDAEEQMLLCDGCDGSYHTFCLMPPLAEIPKGDWRCPKCVAAEVSKPMEAFGFEQAQKEYTLQSFGEMADQFKSDYFNMPVHLIPTTLVEKEYWRILENIDEDVMVEYGADLHTMDHGSGFPTLSSKNLSKEDEVYAKSDWNLNRLPIVPNSILRNIDIDISGMKVPWLYVGMAFSTFCWHTEDHWTPSINYLHWGEPKTWYGIPAKYAEKAEEVMRESAKELFSGQPDLLHHIVTTMNPNVLQANGIPVYRADQYAGEFMVTFPRSYHAGFNQGYNLAEAVNFAPSDWLEMGRKCVEHYSLMRRYCVFCHDELVCKMASQASKLTLSVAAAAYKDMIVMVEQEKKMRRELLEAGLTEAEREAFELLPDDERQCAICKTTCFLSALTSVDQKDTNTIVCLRHFKSMECDPEKLVLRYRYTLDELATFLKALKSRAESYDFWVSRVKEALESRGEKRLEFDDLKEMLEEAHERKYPESELLDALSLTVEEAEKCQTVAAQLSNKKVRTRTRGVAEAKYRLTLEELQLFVNQLETLPCKVSDQESVVELLKQVQQFQKNAQRIISQKSPDAKEVEEMIEKGVEMDVDLPELKLLKQKHKESEWVEEVTELLEDLENSSLENLKELLDTGNELIPSPTVNKALSELSVLSKQVDQWEERARACLSSKPRLPLGDVEKLVKEGEKIGNGLPSLGALKDAVKKAKDWLIKAELNPDNLPYIDTVEALVGRGRPLPIRLEPLVGLESQVASARAWRERTQRVFLKKNSSLSLIEILTPRTESEGKRKKKPKDDASNGCHPIFSFLSAEDLGDPQKLVKAYKDAQEHELENIVELRAQNATNGRNAKGLVECELCLDLFCPSQVPIPKSSQSNDKPPEPLSLRKIKFLCPACQRSRRPRLETILSLLVSLQKLRVRLPEGEALRCLTERAVSWQDRARKALATQEAAASLSKLSEFSQATSNNGREDSGTSSHSEDDEEWKRSSKPVFARTLDNEDLPCIDLSEKTKSTLEDLMMEGDLLEVSLDEKNHLWRILRHTEPRRSKKFPDLDDIEAELESAREEKLRAKRRRRAEAASSSEDEAKISSKAAEDESSRKRKSDVFMSGTKKKRKVQEEEEDEEEQEDCSANPKCLKPAGKEVHWVQCDGCELWFHLYCIGLKPDQVSEDEEFICKVCRPSYKKGKKQSKRQ